MDFESIASAIPPPGPSGGQPTVSVVLPGGAPHPGRATPFVGQSGALRPWTRRLLRVVPVENAAAGEGVAGTPGLASQRWRTLGEEGRSIVSGIEVLFVEAGFVAPVRTAAGTHRSRPLVFVRVVTDAGEGWGECAALADTTYDREDAATAFRTLTTAGVPRLVGSAGASGGRLPTPGRCATVVAAAGCGPLASAAVEMAVGDAHLRSAGQSLASCVSGRAEGSAPAATRASVGGVLGMGADVGALLEAADRLVSEGMSRLKVKIAPGYDVEPLTAVRDRYPRVGLQADANGSYAGVPGGPPLALDDLDLVCVEQPLGVGDFDGHARLAEARSTPICLDESLDSAASVRRALALGACSVVCVKPARLGGIGQALEACEAVTGLGFPLWIGGMFESGYGRAANAGIATGPGRWLPGDLSRPSGYLEHPVTDDPEYVRAGAGGFPPPGGPLQLVVPSGPGLAPPPEPARLRPWCRQRRWFPRR